MLTPVPRSRRSFLQTLVGVGAVASWTGEARAEPGPGRPVAGFPESPAAQRKLWCDLTIRVAGPVLEALERRALKREMPVEAMLPERRAPHAHLEAVGRLLAGIAPWLELPADDTAESRQRGRLAALACAGLDAGTDPQSPDLLNFTHGRQPLVDAAFLAQALLRSPRRLWGGLSAGVRARVIAALESTRSIRPSQSNWLLFAAIIEAFLHRAGRPRDDARLFNALDRHRRWYVGDGWYGDGAEFHTDYYNAFVIQPMLVEVLDVVGGESAEWGALRRQAAARFTRFAAIQERLIAPDGSYPVLGRSIAYRGGAFQGLALAALRRQLPETVTPAQARGALTAVIRRTLEAPGTFDETGWLRIGLAGHQPSLGENYISTGSLYLCAAAFLPLGLPPTDSFWTDPAGPTTWERAWAGHDLSPDKALKDPA